MQAICAIIVSPSPPRRTASEMTITVHYLNNSRAQRILWLLEELEVPYNVVRYERVNMLAPPEFFKTHPLGKSPVITDDDSTIAESGAIVEYIIAKYGRGKLQPTPSGWLDNLYCESFRCQIGIKLRPSSPSSLASLALCGRHLNAAMYALFSILVATGLIDVGSGLEAYPHNHTWKISFLYSTHRSRNMQYSHRQNG